MAAAQWIDAHTPTLSVADSRGLAVRNVAYCRHPLNPSIEARITRNHFDAAGRLVASWDPRLWGTAPRPNLATTHNLQSQPLLVDSVDAGWQLSLLDQAGMARSFWDGRGSQRHTECDELQRPTSVTERMKNDSPRVAEHFAYAGAGAEFALHNQCGQLIRHDHPAGRRSLCEYGVGGLLLAEETRFLLDLAPPDWSSESADTRLEDEVFRTAQQYGPSGEMLCQTDAGGNRRTFDYNLSGELLEIRLRLAGAIDPPQVLVGDILYDALGKVSSERAANGLLTIARYAAEDGRLTGLLSCDARGTPLQHFEYAYDPVGNISSVEDKVALTRYFNQQRIEPINRYRYDSLYQLVEATGREVSQPSHGPALPAWQTTPLDPNQLRNYTQTFNYDAAGNLQTRHHSGVETFEMFTSPGSNRSVADEGSLMDGFDANGNQRELLRGQEMSWDIRNQLSRVTMVRREDGADDSECYFYDSPGHRLRKVRLTETSRRSLRAEVRYLPGLEIHRDTATGEERHVLSVEAGLSHVRALHWVGKLPKGVGNDQLCFCLSDHLNSCTLELDEQGALLSQEVYYPFGGTALWAGSSETEAKYKTIRYSGKERDATGLYCYGHRYYAPWLQRWVSADPAGKIDGVNFYIFVGNDPLAYVDLGGLVRQGINEFLTKDGSWEDMKVNAGRVAMERQESVYNAFDVKPSSMRRDYFKAYAYDSNMVVNDYLRYGREHGALTDRAFSLFFVAPTDIARVSALTKIANALPHTGIVPLYRGGSGGRGTSGEFFRQGSLGPGSVLINTDFTSFTENPYIAAEFAGLNESAVYFDETSVIFEITEHFSPKPIAS
ncbi:insecticidal toxin complex protein TccC [Pseudomonas laurylsulfativorans]|uniref:RHS repeat domain-containing protein n=1 Tax=Pseudomonas laurylsulfativorans TaxID=1943631 RepID=UPI0020A162AF|nr:RHS repeat-associated core domain-containing protein [Pseudomonas laurylsulfativorans]MCP1420222.1 insecticidal toxin complex protein TccC [Pseudomonas laurylsulfativorans]